MYVHSAYVGTYVYTEMRILYVMKLKCSKLTNCLVAELYTHNIV